MGWEESHVWVRGGGVIEIPTEVSRPGERTDVEAIVSNETSSQQKKECYKTEE